MRFRTKLRISLLCLYFAIICCISDNNFVDPFDSQPKIVVKDGHIVFETARNKNITFKSSGGGRITIDGQDLTRIAELAQTANIEGGSVSGSKFSELENRLEELRTLFNNLDTTVNELRSLQTAFNDSNNKINQILGTGSNALQISTVRRNIKKIPRIETSLNRLTQLLETNECLSNPCRNGGTCTDSYNGFICNCPPNWEGEICDTDVNECLVFVGTELGCQNGASCVNRPGTYDCICYPNWYGIHCTTQHDDCSHSTSEALCGHGMCVNQPRTMQGVSNYQCICEQGWTSSGHNPACIVDINECTERQPHCSVNPRVACINLPGTFYCAPCPPGYTGDGYSCHDINECEINNGGCSQSPRVQCTNTIGSRVCGACPPGYNGNGITCDFIGICRVNNGGCHPSAQCFENMAISSVFRECRCPVGFVGSGIGPNGCALQQTGTNCNSNPCIHGSCLPNGDTFSCICNLGFTGSLCELEINECVSNPCQNGGTCTDQQNSFLCVCTDQWQGSTCSEPRQRCGGAFNMEVGAITFPINQNSVYPNGANCAWLVTTTHGKVLNVTFRTFNVEQTIDCSYDFLQIHDGPNAGAHNLGRFCGSQLPKGGNIVTTHNQIYLWFKSDHSISHEGFHLEWNTTDPVCGGEVVERDYGSINSPGYPGNYPHDRDCWWLVRVPLGKRIQFHFATLQIESHTDCAFDYLEIIDGQRQNDPVLARHCSTETPPPITMSGSQALLHFHSDNSASDHGFHITYSSVPGIPGCGGTFTQERGTFSSPNSPDRYIDNIECDWIIRVHPLDRIQIQFSVFDLENHRNCSFDYLEIRDGDSSESPLINRLCGNTMPPRIVSTGNMVWVKFRADHSVTGHGFRAIYTTLCGGLFTDTEGVLKSPFFPDPYPSDRKCEYHIVVPAGSLVQLSFQHFDVEGSIDCLYDFLEVRESHENGTVIGKFCGTLLPETITSRYNELWLQFVTDGSVNNHGFYANYTNIEVGCGGVLTTNHGSISTPNHPNFYPSSGRCSWLIRSDPGFIIRLTFTVFAIEPHRTCANDYVEVRDSNYALIGKYCGNRLPPVLTSTGNQMFITFKSGRSIQQEGFAAAYTFMDSSTACGGNFFTDSGVIRSPGYGPNGTYPPLRDCVWLLEVHNGRQIVLNITDFGLEEGSSCRFDSLDIRNGREERSPLIGKFCGTTIPKSITSHGHVMYLRFKTDRTIGGKGFEIIYDSGTTGCGGTLTTQTGSIESPGYPEPYGHNAQCVWHISVSKGSKVNLIIVEIDIEQHRTCSFDYLQIFDGNSDRSPSLGKYCNNQMTPHFIQSKSNEMFLKFKTDSSQTGRGFRLNYQINCTTTVSGYRGVIESPNYPDLYNQNSNCSWIILAPRGNNITIAFSQLVIEPDLNCQFDYLQIIKVDKLANNRTEVTKYCGTSGSVPRPFNVSSNEAIVNFISDNTVAHIGFRLEWMAVGCGGDFINKNYGQFSSPNYPNGYPHEVECLWHIHSPNGMSIQLTLSDFDIEGNTDCNFDYLKVFGGPDDTSPLILNQCHKITGSVNTHSMGQWMTIKFATDYTVRGRGFSASFVTNGGSCSVIYSTDTGIIYSPKYPLDYDSNDDCEYTIDVKGLHDIEIYFEEFQMPISVNCTDSYLAIFDGPSAESPLLVRHCGTTLPTLNPIRSNGNQVYMRMKANGRSTGKGFKILYKTVCGGTKLLSTNEMGELTSPNYPHHSILNPNCHWILIASQPEEHITLTFTHIDVRISEDCSEHFIEVSEGDSGSGSDTSSPLQTNRYCGDRVPAPITSQGNAFYITSTMGIFRATYATSTSFCGGDFLSPEGFFMSPNYPNSYPLETECIWIIRASPGNRVTFNFMSFQIENSEYCNTDYVELREQDSGGPLLGRYCGQTVPTLNFTSTNILWIKFRSDDTGTAQGFQAYYALEHGIDLTGTSGQISSPGYPNELRPQDSSYTWTITVPQYKYVSLDFTELSLHEAYNGECEAYVIALDGIAERAPELGRYCGFSLPNTLVSTGNTMTVSLVMTQSFAGKFFSEWRAINYTEVRALRNTRIETLGNTSFEITLNKSASYVLTSPGYPTGYGRGLNYNWTFITSQSFHFHINVTDFNTEGSRRNCYYDMIKILFPRNIQSLISDSSQSLADKSFWSIQNGTVCGRFNGSLEVLAFHIMRINFVTDWSVNMTGFNLTVSTVCGGRIYGSNGYITTEDVMNAEKCEWVIMVRVGRTVQITFESINIGDNNNCQFSYIMLKNGRDRRSPNLGGGKYCGRDIPTIPESSTHRVRVMFYARRDMHADFRLRFNEVGIGCGGQLELSADNRSIAIMSPNYPLLPPHSLECDWVIRSPPNSNIRFDFVFVQNPPWNCNKTTEFVEIRDGGTELSPLIDKYCVPPRMTNSIRSTGNYLFVRFVTSDRENLVSFKANIRINDCGGSYYVYSFQELNIPNFPNNYTDNSECIYYIRSYYPNNYFNINITSMDIIGNSDCSSGDYIELRDESPTGDIIGNGRYCGSSDENSTITLKSKSYTVFMIFKSDTSQTGKGLKITFRNFWSRCGGAVENAQNRGLITSPEYPNAVSRSLYCVWHLFAPVGRSIKITFLEYNLKVDPRNASNCLDSIRPRYGMEFEKYLWPRCGTVLPEPIQTKTHITSFNFKSTGLAPNEGFKIEYSADEEEVCGGLLSGNSGTFSSYLFGESNFTEPFSCVWDLSIPTNSSNHTIAFIFDVFEIATSLRCSEGGLRLEHYNSQYRYFWHFMNIFCGNLTQNGKFELILPSQHYYGYTNPRLFLMANYSNGYRGISGTYFINECGGYFDQPEGEYISPNYPNNFPLNSFCIWNFRVEWGTKLRISFLEFNLDNDCEKDYIQYSWGGYKDSPVSDRYCGSQLPHEIESTSRRVVVIFKGTASNTQNTRRFKISVRKVEHGCGGLSLHSYGSIESFRYPQRYDNNIECIYTIQMPFGYHINFSFVERFDIETTDNCQSDYLSFQEKINSEDQLTEFKRFCGHNRPEPFKSQTNKVDIIFRSNDNTNGDGFKLNYNIACGELYTESSGVIVSPNYPNNYQNNIRCQYLIRLNSTKDFIRLEFEEFQVENHLTCRWDGLDIYLGNDTNAVHMGPYCGKEKPPVIISPGVLLLTFRSDPSVNDKGFRASYSVSSCGGNLTDESGVITNPIHFSQVSYLDCIWIIRVKENRSIETKFNWINLASYYNCYYDRVEFRDGYNRSSPLIGRYCDKNNDVGVVIKSTNNTLWVRYRFDASYERSGVFGFSLAYRTTLGEGQGCGGVFNNHTEGYIQSPDIDGDGNYDTDLNCWFHFIVNEQKVVKITFERMNIEESPTNSSKCSYDYIEMRDGLSHTAALIDRYCGTTPPSPIISSTNKLVLHFFSDSTGVRSGFKAKYEAIDRVCGGFLNVTNVTQTLQSNNYPNGYPTSLRCKWLLTDATRQYWWLSVFLKFIDLDINCNNNDYIEFNADTHSQYRISSYRMCGTKAPPLITSRNGLWMTFVTNASPAQNHRGFKMEYTISTCNMTYTDDSGIIVNAYYPDYQYERYCQINITAKVGHTIALYFIDFSFYKGENSGCLNNNMTVKDGFNVNSATLGGLCGLTLPNPIFSTGDKLMIEIRNYYYSSKYFISYTTTDAGRGCGGNLTSFNGTFTSPLYPQPYNLSTECKWFVHSFGLHSLTLRFLSVSLSSTIGCQSNYIEVYEGLTELPSNRVIRICGDDNPSPYQSRGNILLIKLVTNTNNTGTGFRAQYYFNTQEMNATKEIMTSNLRPHLTRDGSVYFPSDGIMFRHNNNN